MAKALEPGRDRKKEGSRGMSVGKNGNLVFLECISNILEQKLEFLNRTRTSLNLSFFIQELHMNTLSFFFYLLFVPILMNHWFFQYDLSVLNHV